MPKKLFLQAFTWFKEKDLKLLVLESQTMPDY